MTVLAHTSLTSVQHLRMPVPMLSASTSSEVAQRPVAGSSVVVVVVKRWTCIVSLRWENNQGTDPTSPSCWHCSVWPSSEATYEFACFVLVDLTLSLLSGRVLLGSSHSPARSPRGGGTGVSGSAATQAIGLTLSYLWQVSCAAGTCLPRLVSHKRWSPPAGQPS